MPISSNKSGSDPNYSDDDITAYLIHNPDTTIARIQEKFRCRTVRAVALRNKARKILADMPKEKKVGSTDWREWFKFAQEHQRLHKKSSFSQDHAVINMQKKFGISADKPIVIQAVSDIHIGSIATNYDAIVEITEGLLNTPELFWVLNGDLTETTAVFRNALAVHSQVMSIEEQHNVLESWLKDIQHKVVSAGWDNHGIEREEKIGAYSHIKQLLNRGFVYHNGMGRIDIEHGDATYKLLVSHKIEGSSTFNILNGVKRLIRTKHPDVDIGITGDLHQPCAETYFEGKIRRAVMMSGSTKVDCGYSKRYFDLYQHMYMPCVVLFPNEKWFGAYMTAAEALAVARNMPEPPNF